MYPYTERFPSKLNSINSVGDTSPYFVPLDSAAKQKINTSQQGRT